MTGASKPVRRSAYAERLREFPETVFADERAVENHGRWHEWFARRTMSFDGQIVLDIGCADAEFLARVAQQHPRRAFIGLDWKYKPVYEGACKIAQAELRNVALLRARAQDLERIFADREMNHIWIFHPEPCDKPAELNNRLLAVPFLRSAHRVLRNSSATLSLKTDHPEYFQWALDRAQLPEILRRFRTAMQSLDYWNDPQAQAHTANRVYAGHTTKYEARFRKKRKPIYLLELQKR
jgi:tRNA (guanine-N(7)-)-methyltransferase